MAVFGVLSLLLAAIVPRDWLFEHREELPSIYATSGMKKISKIRIVTKNDCKRMWSLEGLE